MARGFYVTGSIISGNNDPRCGCGWRRSSWGGKEAMSLKKQTFTAVRWTTLASLGRAALRFGQIAILARLLVPADFGLMAIVASITAFMQVFADLGVSTAIIHYQDISSDQLSSLYWLNVMIGLVLALALVATSPWISHSIFHQPALVPILALMSINFIFFAAGQQLVAQGEKALIFPVLARVEILATLGGSVTAVIWAWLSPTVYALVAGVLMSGFLRTLLLWLLASQGWRPTLRFRPREIDRFLRFGAYTMGATFLNSLGGQADVLIGGRFFSAATLGSYSLPRNLSLNIVGITNPIITRVGLPVMAKTQEDRAFLKTVYLKTMRMTASVNFPVFIACAVFSRDVVLLLFGAKWTASAHLLIYLAFYGMLRSCINPVGSLVYAVGKAELHFWWDFARLMVVFPVLWVASRFGISGIAEGQMLVVAGLLIPAWYFLVRPHCDAGLGENLMTLLSPLVAALFAVLVGYLAVAHWNAPVYRLGGMLLVGVPAYLAASLVVNRSWVTAMRELILRRS